MRERDRERQTDRQKERKKNRKLIWVKKGQIRQEKEVNASAIPDSSNLHPDWLL